MNKYKLIDVKFKELMNELDKIFSDKEIRAIHDFLDFGENGLALDVIVGTFIEEKKVVTPKIVELINELLNILKLNPNIYHSVQDIKLLTIKKAS